MKTTVKLPIGTIGEVIRNYLRSNYTARERADGVTVLFRTYHYPYHSTFDRVDIYPNGDLISYETEHTVKDKLQPSNVPLYRTIWHLFPNDPGAIDPLIFKGRVI